MKKDSQIDNLMLNIQFFLVITANMLKLYKAVSINLNYNI